MGPGQVSSGSQAGLRWFSIKFRWGPGRVLTGSIDLRIKYSKSKYDLQFFVYYYFTLQ
jgi:hypothetical protein